MDSKDVAALINRLIESGWTQAQIGKAIGTTQGTISVLASGRDWDKGPAFKTIAALLVLAHEKPPKREAAA